MTRSARGGVWGTDRIERKYAASSSSSSGSPRGVSMKGQGPPPCGTKTIGIRLPVRVSGIDQIQKQPSLSRRDTGELTARRTDNAWSGRYMLRAGVHVPEKTLHRSGAKSNRACGFVHERRNFLRRPCGIRQGEPGQRVLSYGQFVSAKNSFRSIGPDLIYECACGAIGGFGVGIAFLKRVTVTDRSPASHFRADDCGKLIEHPAADSTGPAGMAHQRKTDDPDRVKGAAAFRRFRDGEVRVGFRHESVFDRVIDAACGTQSHDVP